MPSRSQYHVFLHCLQYTVVHIYICGVTGEPLCRQNRIPKSHVQLANHAIYLCDDLDPMMWTKDPFSFSCFTRLHSFLRWPSLKRFSSTHRLQLGKLLSASIYSGSIYNTNVVVKPGKIVQLDVVVDVRCWLLFSFAVVNFLFFAHRYLILTPGHCCFYLVTHTPTLKRFCADAHGFTL